MSSATEVLAAARDLLFEEGWSPNGRRGPHGPRCIFWALVDAEPQVDGQASREGRSALSYLKATAGTDDLLGWNDSDGRTFDDVVDVLDRAIKTAETAEAVT